MADAKRVVKVKAAAKPKANAQSKAKPIMVQGTMSGAGKSLLVTALCRIFTEDGYKVAPFKSQNMALNSYVTKDGLEMGRAQVVQAAACGKEPDVRMNPVLLKPSTDTGSQVIVNGEVLRHMPAKEYYAYKSNLIPSVLEAYNSLAEENDIIVIEGAGSPAEINLKKDDFVNMGLAELVDAPVLLAGDIDRGGVFAQLYGTVALLEEKEKERVRGLLINKFRGDVSLLGSGLDQLQELTGVPTLGVIPYVRVKLDEEDSLAESLDHKTAQRPVDVAVLRLPKISNFTDFAPLENHPVLGLRYVESVDELGSPDLVIIPGTKSTVADLLWLRQTGLEAAVLKLAARDIPILGICGGYQMLGEELVDRNGVEVDGGGTFRGLELLPLRTVFESQKTRTRVRARVLEPIRAMLYEGAEGTSPREIILDGYEIHNGTTRVTDWDVLGNGTSSFCKILEEEKEGGVAHVDGFVRGNVFGTYLHGLFDSGELTEALARWLCFRKGIQYEALRPQSHDEQQEEELTKLAAVVREALDMDAVYNILGVR